MRCTPRTGRKRAHLRPEPGWYGGYEVLDSLGQKIGGAERIFANGDGHPVYVRVRLGLFAWRSMPIPVQEDGERQTLVLG